MNISTTVGDGKVQAKELKHAQGATAAGKGQTLGKLSVGKLGREGEERTGQGH